MKLVTTLQMIKSFNPNSRTWSKLLQNLGEKVKTPNLETEVDLKSILNILGLDDAMLLSRCFPELATQIKWYSLRCAERVRNLMKNECSTKAIDVTKQYLNGEATREELNAASNAAWDELEYEGDDEALWVAAAVSSLSQRWEYLIPSAVISAMKAAGADVEEEKKTQIKEFIRLIECHENGIEYKS